MYRGILKSVSEMGVSIVEMYSGGISLTALCVSIRLGLLYIIPLTTELRPSSEDEVSKSAYRTRACNFNSLSTFAADVDSQVTKP